MNLIVEYELMGGKDIVVTTAEHYDAIKAKAPKSISEMKRQFISGFKSGNDYLTKTAKILNPQSYHIREFLKLREVYNNEDLNLILEYCINNEIYRIEGIKEILKDKYFEIIIGEKDVNTESDIENRNNKSINAVDLVRETSYYEGGQN